MNCYKYSVAYQKIKLLVKNWERSFAVSKSSSFRQEKRHETHSLASVANRHCLKSLLRAKKSLKRLKKSLKPDFFVENSEFSIWKKKWWSVEFYLEKYEFQNTEIKYPIISLIWIIFEKLRQNPYNPQKNTLEFQKNVQKSKKSPKSLKFQKITGCSSKTKFLLKKIFH